MMFEDKTNPFIKIVMFTLAVALCCSMASAQPVGNDEFYSSDENQNKGRPFRDIPPQYPECADLVYEHWEMTDELHALAEERRGLVDPESRETTQEINDLASQRSEVTGEIQRCVRDASQNRLLKAKIEKNVQLPPEETTPDQTEQDKETEETPPSDSPSSDKTPPTKPNSQPTSQTPPKTPKKTTPTQPKPKPGPQSQPTPKEPQLGPPGKGKEAPPPKQKKPEVHTPGEGPGPPTHPRPPLEEEIPEPDELPPVKEPTPLPASTPEGPNFTFQWVDPPAFSYVKGMGKGFEDCAKDFGANVTFLWQAAQAMMAGNFPKAEQILGIPEQVLKGIWEDFNKPIILSPQGGKVTPEEESKIAYENGRAAAKRLCEAIPLGKAAKCVGGVFAKACGKVGKKVVDAGKKVGKRVQQAGKKAKEAVAETGNKVKAKASEAAERAKNKVAEAKKKAGEKAKDIKEKLIRKKEEPRPDKKKSSGPTEEKPSDPKPGNGPSPRGPPFKTKPLSPIMSKLDKGELDPTYKVIYFTKEQLEKRKLSIKDGKIYWNGKPFDTQGIKGEVMYIMDENGDFYWAVSEPKRIHHSSLGQGKAVAAAGTLKVENGVLKHLDRESGHYMPDESHLSQAESWLKQQGVNTKGVVQYELKER